MLPGRGPAPLIPQPLSGLRVLELGRVLAVPFAAQILRDLGADVVKVERPGTGDESRDFGPPFDPEGRSYYYLSVNRGKEVLFLDLKRPEGQERLRGLIRESDVYLHNWAPGKLERLGFGSADALALNPRVVCCSVAGFDAGTPDQDRPALDMLAQAATGLMALTGPAGGEPVRAGVPVSDLAAGLYAAVGVLAALEERHRTGKGRIVETSLQASSLALLTYQASRFYMTREEPARMGNAHPSIVPYDAYRTSDGTVVIAVANDAVFGRLCEALDRPDLGSDPRFATNPLRVEHRAVLEPEIARSVRKRTTEDLEARCRALGVPCGPVRGVAEALAGHADLPFPLRFSGARPMKPAWPAS